MRRLLVVEPDRSACAMLRRVLTAAGYTAEDFESVHHARILLDDDGFDLAVVDEVAGGGAPLAEVQFLRERYPRLPVVVTGTLLTPPVLLELLRLDVADALPKPFTPAELRDAVARALVRTIPRYAEARDYAAAIAAARAALAAGEPARAAPALARAYAAAPLDADVVALEALRAELEGRDADAARGYRAALALRHDEGGDAPDCHEGLCRLAAYGPARPVAALGPAFVGAPMWLVTDPSRDLPRGRPSGLAGPVVVVTALALAPDDGAVYLRASDDRAFALLATSLASDGAARALARVGAGPVVGSDATLDVARLAGLRDAALPSGAPTARPPESGP